MSSGVITLNNIKNQKQRNFLKYVSDIFDEHRGNIDDDLAFTKFTKGGGTTHTILFNTATPELNGKTLIQFDNDKILFAPVDIQSLICNEPSNNPTINILTQPKNNHVWEAKSNEKIIKLLINLKNSSPISGFSIRFADAVRTKYRMSLVLANNDGEILSQVATGIDSSWDTNNQQFFQLSNTVDGVTKAVIDIELVGQNKDFEWKINNISFYSNMNIESLKSLSELGVITWSLVQNSVFLKNLEQQGEATQELLALGKPSQEQQLLSAPTLEGYIDHYGSSIPYKPILDRQNFDNLTADQLTKISNIKRLYTITDLPTGDKIYTFETHTVDRNFTISFSPLEEMNKYPDDPEVQLDKIQKSGMIKKGGFKNYVLTLYIKLDGLTMTDQKLLWKYGGYYFNIARPECSRAVNVTIPVNNKSGDIPHVSTEYFFGTKNDMTGRMMVIKDGSFKGLEEGKWVGLQFIRQVDTENNRATQIVRVNKDPFRDGNTINPSGFQDYIQYNDVKTDDHKVCNWGGTQDLISVTGAKYVSLFGISMYEVEFQQPE